LDSINLEVKKLTKYFERKIIFKDANFTLSNGDSIAITGDNGSGKSTLIKILANTLHPSKGEIQLNINGKSIEENDRYQFTGFVSPYLNLYDEFTAYENLEIVTKIRNTDKRKIDEVLGRVGLLQRKNDTLRIFSSGMKQRMKAAFAIIHKPLLLLLDEPTSNLDTEGIKLIDEICEEQKISGILVIATNDQHEKSICGSSINLNELKR
jgi:heme exporter protein A